MDHHAVAPAIAAQVVPDPERGFRCSACTGYIRPDASSCKHCGAQLRPPGPRAAPLSLRGNLLVMLYLGLTVATVVWVLRHLDGVLGAVAAPTAGITVFVLVGVLTLLLIATPEQRADPSARQLPRYAALTWLALMAIITLPVVVGMLLSPIVGWPATPLALSLAGTMIYLILGPLTDRTPALGQQILDRTTEFTSVRQLWFQWHLVLIAYSVVLWIGAVWGANAKDIATFVLMSVLAMNRLFGWPRWPRALR